MMNGSITPPDDESWRDAHVHHDGDDLGPASGVDDEREAIQAEAEDEHVEHHDGATITAYTDEDDETHSVVQIVPRVGHEFDHEVLALVRSQQPDEKGRETVADLSLISLRRPIDERDATLRYARQLVRHAQPWEPRALPRAARNDTLAAPWAARIVPIEQDWYRVAPPPRSWLLRDQRTNAGALPLGKVGMLIGEGGVSKTMALFSLAIAVATGTTWLGTYDAETSGRVLVLLGEEDAPEVHRRAYNSAQAARINPPPANSIVTIPLAGVPCPMVISGPDGEPEDAPFLLWLRSYIETSGPWALIVVDPLSRFAGVDAETDNAAATRFVQALESLAVASGATVMVAHHTNKTARANGATVTGASARGSSAFYDGVRWACALSAEQIVTVEGDGAVTDEIVTLATAKSNYSKKGDPVLLRRDTDHGGALVPMHGGEVRAFAEARQANDPTARRRAQRTEERESRQAKDASERDRRAIEREAAVRARDAEDDRAVLDAIAAAPDATVRALVAVVRGARACGGDRALAAVHRVRPKYPEEPA